MGNIVWQIVKALIKYFLSDDFIAAQKAEETNILLEIKRREERIEYLKTREYELSQESDKVSERVNSEREVLKLIQEGEQELLSKIEDAKKRQEELENDTQSKTDDEILRSNL